MTTQPTDEGNATLDENLIDTATTTAEPAFVEEDDPIIAEMRAAEAEIAAAAGAQAPATEAKGPKPNRVRTSPQPRQQRPRRKTRAEAR